MSSNSPSTIWENSKDNNNCKPIPVWIWIAIGLDTLPVPPKSRGSWLPCLESTSLWELISWDILDHPFKIWNLIIKSNQHQQDLWALRVLLIVDTIRDATPIHHFPLEPPHLNLNIIWKPRPFGDHSKNIIGFSPFKFSSTWSPKLSSMLLSVIYYIFVSM